MNVRVLQVPLRQRHSLGIRTLDGKRSKESAGYLNACDNCLEIVSGFLVTKDDVTLVFTKEGKGI